MMQISCKYIDIPGQASNASIQFKITSVALVVTQPITETGIRPPSKLYPDPNPYCLVLHHHTIQISNMSDHLWLVLPTVKS